MTGMTAPTAPAPTAAEPRQARSRATRQRLLGASVETLVDLGHAGATTPEVCARAGVSQGALFKHFPSKAALLAATVEHLFAGLVEDYRRAFARAAESADPIDAAVRLLWEIFRRPALLAAFELMVAARTDAELAEALDPVQAHHGVNVRRLARELFPEAAASDPGRFDDTLDLLLSAMQGAALGSLSRRDPQGEERRLRFLTRLARALLPGGGAPACDGPAPGPGSHPWT